VIQSGKMAPMANHPHTIDRWDEATGENLVERIAGVGDYLFALATYRAARHRFIDLRESPSRCATICRIVSVGLPLLASANPR
jgi:hypothetical protein